MEKNNKTNGEKINCEFCGDETWLKNSYTVMDEDDNQHEICVSCWNDIKDEKDGKK